MPDTAVYGTHPVKALQSPGHIVLFADSQKFHIFVAGTVRCRELYI